jgi:hypothetical protein
LGSAGFIALRTQLARVPPHLRPQYALALMANFRSVSEDKAPSARRFVLAYASGF